MLTWLREIPINGALADVHRIVGYSKWLATHDGPKLFINADPGSILVGAQREFCRTWPHQTEVTVQGIHFILEDSPDDIGPAIAEWRSRPYIQLCFFFFISSSSAPVLDCLLATAFW